MRIGTRVLAARIAAVSLAAVLALAMTPSPALAAPEGPEAAARLTAIAPLAEDFALLDFAEAGAGDDTMATARDITSLIPRAGDGSPGWGKAPATELHTIDTANGGAWDEDWYKFYVSSNDFSDWTQLSYMVEAYTSDPDVDVVLDVYGPGHMTVAAANTITGVDNPANCIVSVDDAPWTDLGYRGHWSSASILPHDHTYGWYYVRVRPYYSGSFTGRAGTYTLRIKAGQLTRLAGTDRVGTAIRASQETWPSRPQESLDTTVVIAHGWGYADALAAAGLAGACDMPILLTPAGYLPTAVGNEIKRLGAKGAYVIGGPSTIGNEVIEDLQVFLAPSKIKRVWGDDRVKTSVAVLNETKRVLATKGQTLPKTVFLAHGYNFPDALAVSPVAYANSAAVLLTHQGYLDTAARNAIAAEADDVVVVGGGSAVSDDVTLEVVGGGGVPANRIHRVSGQDRYETAKEVAAWACDLKGPGIRNDGKIGTSANPTGLDVLTRRHLNAYASGANYPDALAGGAMAGKASAPLLLTHPSYAPVYLFGADGEMPPGSTAWFSDLHNGVPPVPILRSYLLGGPTTVGDGVFLEIDNLTGFRGGP